MGVNNLPKTVTRQRRDYDLNPIENLLVYHFHQRFEIWLGEIGT